MSHIGGPLALTITIITNMTSPRTEPLDKEKSRSADQ
jgi:hypothetical protein